MGVPCVEQAVEIGEDTGCGHVMSVREMRPSFPSIFGLLLNEGNCLQTQNLFLPLNQANIFHMFDDIALQILTELKANARISYRELGEMVGLSAPAVADRVKRLERDGVITGYTIVTDQAALGYPIQAIIRVMSSGTNASAIDQLANDAPEVVECNRVTGSESHVIRAWFRDVQHIGHLGERLWQYGDTTSNVVTSTPVSRRHLRLE
jgi:Lrp/AsnC family leucine-responsive transcriptional regulator